MPKTLLIIAIDTNDYDKAMDIALNLRGLPVILKFGLEFLHAHGAPGAAHIAAHAGLPVMYDAKLADIPNTVGKATSSILGNLQPAFLTVYGLTGLDGIREVRKVIDQAQAPTQILAITALTSWSVDDLAALLPGGTAASKSYLDFYDGLPGFAANLARKSVDAGAHGVVCSVHEAQAMRQILGPQAPIICPGIRLTGNQAGDQKRIATPTDAVQAGASGIVVGRPITEASNPVAIVHQILAELEAAEQAL